MFRVRLSAVSGLLLIVFVAATAVASDTPEQPVSIAVENISLASATSDRIQLSANVSLISSRRVTLREVMFAELHASGVPFYASPISGRLALIPNQKVLPSQPLLLTVYLHDLSSLKPLHALVSDGKISITGTAYATVDLNTAEKVILRTGHVRVPVKINSALELRIPGGLLAKAAALALIDYGQAALESAGSAWQTGAMSLSEQRRQLWQDYAPALVLAHATYELRDAAGKTFQHEATAMGFRVNGMQVVLPKAVLEPWKFDTDVAANMKQDGSLKVSNYDLALWSSKARLRDDSGQLSGTQALCLSAHQLRLLPFTKDDSEPMFLPGEEDKTQRVKVHRRQVAAALGLVEITDPAASPMSPILANSNKPADVNRSTPVVSLGVFRFPDGLEAKAANPGLLLVLPRAGASSLELDTPIDSTGWGSPVISPEGIVGVVTSESSVISIADAAKELNFSINPQHTGEQP